MPGRRSGLPCSVLVSGMGGAEVVIVVVLLVAAVFVLAALVRGSGADAGPAPAVPEALQVRGERSEVAARLAQLLVANGAVITVQSPEVVAGHVLSRKKPSLLVAALLWFVCIIPMVLYLINSSKDVQEPFSLSLSERSGRIRVEGSGYGRGLRAACWVMDQLDATEKARESRPALREANPEAAPPASLEPPASAGLPPSIDHATRHVPRRRISPAMPPEDLEGGSVPVPEPATLAPGWYADPLGAGLRWWDGSRWTEHVQDA